MVAPYAVTALLVAQAGSPVACDTAAGMRLVEVGSVTAPVGFHVAGAILEDSSTVLIWSATHPEVVRLGLSDGHRDHLPSPGGVPPFRVSRRDGRVEVVEWGSNSIRDLRTGTEVGDLSVLPPGHVPSDATAIGAGWYLLSQLSGGVHAWTLDPNQGALTHLGAFPSGSKDPTESVAWRITDAPQGPIAFQVARPTRRVFLDSLGATTVAEWDPAEETEGLWAALPIHFLNAIGIQTLVDLRSDQRIHRIFDSDLRCVGERVLNVPLAFVDAHRGSNAFLAIRRVGAVELVVYRWVAN